MTTPGEQGRWVSACIDALLAGGVGDVVLSPGSRSTPLVLALLEREVRIHDVIDERSAGFFALGLARVGCFPALVCTSGTAGAHYLPALMEASASHLPVVAITADRPPELHEQGANQTTDQGHLFGTHVRAFVELGAAHESERARRGIAQRTARALALAHAPIPGPVHLNVRLRKPLEEGPFGPTTSAPSVVHAPRMLPDPAGIRAIASRLQTARRPLVAAGPAPLGAVSRRERVGALLGRLGAPLFADATSQLRFMGGTNACTCDDLDALDADFVLQIGEAPIASAWLGWVEGRARAVIADHGWPDPTGDAERIVWGDVRESLRGLDEALAGDPVRSPWYGARRVVPHGAHFDACVIAETVVRAASAGSLLMIGNSNVARAIDRVCADVDLGVLHQRGLSGIDGLIAGAAGASAAKGPITLLLGDVSALHDLGSLLTVRGRPVRIVIVHDDGGRIFEQLPIARHLAASAFAKHFAMEHGLGFEHAAAQFGLTHRRVDDVEGLEQALALDGPIVIEARVST